MWDIVVPVGMLWKIWKQITTTLSMGGTGKCCSCRYVVENLKANHNTFPFVSIRVTVVPVGMLWKIWKQITTISFVVWKSIQLFLSVCCGKFESKSQPKSYRSVEIISCSCRYVVENLKANHNYFQQGSCCDPVVPVGMLWKIWKQITTDLQRELQANELFLSVCCGKFESKSQQ